MRHNLAGLRESAIKRDPRSPSLRMNPACRPVSKELDKATSWAHWPTGTRLDGWFAPREVSHEGTAVKHVGRSRRPGPNIAAFESLKARVRFLPTDRRWAPNAAMNGSVTPTLGSLPRRSLVELDFELGVDQNDVDARGSSGMNTANCSRRPMSTIELDDVQGSWRMGNFFRAPRAPMARDQSDQERDLCKQQR